MRKENRIVSNPGRTGRAEYLHDIVMTHSETNHGTIIRDQLGAPWISLTKSSEETTKDKAFG